MVGFLFLFGHVLRRVYELSMSGVPVLLGYGFFSFASSPFVLRWVCLVASVCIRSSFRNGLSFS